MVAISIARAALAAAPSWIIADKSGNGFVQTPSGAPFIPWGLNYEGDDHNHLIEDYWDTNWSKVESDFQDIKRLGANLVRVHLQFAKFMAAPGKPNQVNLDRLEKLIGLAEDLGLYLDITGLGTYRLADLPAWYRAMGEKDHWAAQAQFWEAIAQVCAGRPGVFAYNLINEPIATASRRPAGEWTHPAATDGLHYVEYIDLNPSGRKPPEIARAWLHQMTQAIRKHDQRHMITVGLLWVEYARPEDEAGFPPSKIAPEVDFLAVHVYPERGKIDVALNTLKRYKAGKPTVIEETFPLKCSVMEMETFLNSSRGIANGWLGIYWKTPEDPEGRRVPRNQLMNGWLNLFQMLNPNR